MRQKRRVTQHYVMCLLRTLVFAALRYNRMSLRLLGMVTNLVPLRLAVNELMECIAHTRVIIKAIGRDRKGIEL